MCRGSQKIFPKEGDSLLILGPSKTWASSLVLVCITLNFSSGYTLTGEGVSEGPSHMHLPQAYLVSG